MSTMRWMAAAIPSPLVGVTVVVCSISNPSQHQAYLHLLKRMRWLAAVSLPPPVVRQGTRSTPWAIARRRRSSTSTATTGPPPLRCGTHVELRSFKSGEQMPLESHPVNTPILSRFSSPTPAILRTGGYEGLFLNGALEFLRYL